MSFSLDLNANQINQALNAAYTGLVSAGTGIVRLTGDQQISGIKTFNEQVYLSGLSNFPSVNQIVPTGNAVVDLGSSSNRFRTGYFSGVTGFTGYFEYLKVTNLDANVAVNLTDKTGTNLTLSGQTNVQNFAVSGNQTIASGLTVSGDLNVTGNTVLAGTITSTGNKSFSGLLNQSGNVNIFGAESVSGNLRVTGDIYCTGNFSANGNVSFTGGYSQTGSFFINSNGNPIVFTGNGGSHQFVVFAPMSLNGAIYHNGAFLHSGNFSNSGNIVNTGSLTNIGDLTVNGNISSNKVSTTGIITSGTSNTAAFLIRNNLTSSPSGGALEYNIGQFFTTNELTGAPTRALVNQTFSYLAPQNFYSATPTANAVTPLLGSTGIYLNTGRYNIKYEVRFAKPGTTGRVLTLGITGSQPCITDRIGSFVSSPSTGTVGNASVTRKAFFGTGATDNIFTGVSNIDGNSSDTFNSFYTFDTTVTITGLTKIRPIFSISFAETLTGRAFSMQVTQLATGTGVGLVGANGPWSDA